MFLISADLLSRYQSRAFLLLPMCFNIGVIIGPILGGLLADPAGSYPHTFGGVGWLLKFPYAPPNILSAFFLFMAAVAVFFGLEEVSLPPQNNISWTIIIYSRLSKQYATKKTLVQNVGVNSQNCFTSVEAKELPQVMHMPLFLVVKIF